jgi:hypothetical protein
MPSPLLLVLTPGQDLFYLLVLHFLKRVIAVYDGCTGSFIVTFSYIVLLNGVKFICGQNI